MASKNKIVDAFAETYKELLALPLPDTTQAQLRRLHRAFTDLRQHDSEQARMVEDVRATLEARDKKLEELRREVQTTTQASQAKDAKLLSLQHQDAEQAKTVRELRATLATRDKTLDELQVATQTLPAKDALIHAQHDRIAALEKEIRLSAKSLQKRVESAENQAKAEKREKAWQQRLEGILKEFKEECHPTARAQWYFRRFAKWLLDQGLNEVAEFTDALDTYQQLLIAACLQYGSLKLPETVPNFEALKLHLSKQEEGLYLLEVKTAALAKSDTDGSADKNKEGRVLAELGNGELSPAVAGEGVGPKGMEPSTLPFVQAFLVCQDVVEDHRRHEHILIRPFFAINAVKFPVNIPVGVFVYMLGGQGSFPMELQLRDQKERPIWQCTANKPLQFRGPRMHYRWAMVDLMIPVPELGAYHLVLLAKGEELSRHPFLVEPPINKKGERAAPPEKSPEGGRRLP